MNTKKSKNLITDDWSKALSAYQQGQFENATKLCKKVTSTNPNYSEANNLLGAIALNSKDYSGALKAFSSAIKSNPNNSSYHNNLGIALRGLSRFKEAKKCYEKSIDLQPNYPDAYYNLGNILRDLKEEEKAIESFRQATQLKPDYHGAWNNLGNALRALKRSEEALDAYKAALNIRDDEQTRSNLAFALGDLGDNRSSLDLQRKTVTAQPDNAALHFNLANSLRDADLFDESIIHYRHALALQPDYAAAANNLGSVWMKKSDFLAALECYRRSSFLEPQNSDYLANSANAEMSLKNYARAISTIQLALDINPENAGYHFNLANYLRQRQKEEPSARIKKESVIEAFKKAIDLQPIFPNAWNNLGAFYSDLAQDEDAIRCYETAINQDPDNFQLHFNLAQRLNSSGDIESSRVAFENGLRIKEHAGARIRCETMFPAIMESEEAVDHTRQDIKERLASLIARKFEIRDPMLDIAGAPLFYLAYHGKNNVELMTAYATLIKSVCPAIEYTSPHCNNKPHLSNSKIKVGFISKFFTNHTIGKFFRGILKNLNREIFELYAFMPPAPQDDVTTWIKAHLDGFVVLSQLPSEACKEVASYELDILVYTDIGMEPFTYYLAFSRLAPIQCAMYGHPDTTGISSIDYYLSGGACESPEADLHYTEKLIRLDPNSTYTYYYRPLDRATHKTRADLGLLESKHLYTCAQSMFKIHPEMDAVFDEILERDVNGVLLMFDDVSQRRVDLFKRRLQNRMHNYDRVIFLPRKKLPDFLQILHLSDALLDSFHFCGGNTSFDSFASESPVVTLPGEFMRGRQTMGLYKRMGFMDLVAEDKADYVNKALHLGTDTKYRQQMREELAKRVPVIYEDVGIVRALEEFFISVTQ